MVMAVRKGVPILAAEDVLNKADVVLESTTESSGPLPEGMSEKQFAT